jgi:hypothetical protein
VYAPLFRHPAPCPEPQSTIFEIGSSLFCLEKQVFANTMDELRKQEFLKAMISLLKTAA